MKTYNINGKECTKFELNKRCAELMGGYLNIPQVAPNAYTEWDDLMDKHNCNQLTAACICFVEMNDD